MSIFSEVELSYLRDTHPIARLATVGPDGTPHVMPLGMYEVDAVSGTIVTTGRDLTSTKKWRDVGRSGRAAIVFDDVLPPFRPRGIEVRGRAEVALQPQPSILIHPERIISWGLDASADGRRARTVRRQSP